MTDFDPRPGRPRITGEPPGWVFNLLLALGGLASLAIVVAILLLAVAAIDSIGRT